MKKFNQGYGWQTSLIVWATGGAVRSFSVGRLQNLLLENAFPDPVLRYLSKSRAFCRSEKAKQVCKAHGRYFLV
jgi:hypothetical protein